MSWLTATTTVPTVSLISLTGWAAFATSLAGWQAARCYRWHYGADETGPIVHDSQPPATHPATPDRDAARAAS